MNTFPKTHAATGYAARHSPDELARARHHLLARLGACEDFLPASDITPAGGRPETYAGRNRDQR